ncbi:hypothetical protein [Cronobacter dublinensis]|uniref:hypothetical protein n=1 Tax=Cronobacter dublinensis TaxID=413497 RepID=UPI001F43057B|nr:hypothetical protein [Cronobacter dublinensis]
MKGRITSRKSVLSCMLMLALSGQSSWAAQNNRVAQGNDFLSTIQQIDVKPMDFPEPTRRPQTPSASRAQINDLQQEIARLKKQLKAAEQEKKSLGAPDALEAQNTQLLKDNSALAKENDRLNRSLQNAQREQGATTTQQAARIEALERKTAELQATLASKTAELAALKKTSDTHAVSESALQKQIARLEQEKAALAQQNTQSTTRFNNDMQALRAELNKRAEELVALKNAGDKRAQSESALQKQLAQLEQEKAALAKQNTQSVDALNQKTQALQAELDKRAAGLAALKKAGADHAQSASALQKQLAQLEQEKATLAKQNTQSVDALNQKTQALQAELDKRVNEVAALKQQNDLLELKTSTLSKDEKEKLQKTQAEQAALLQKNQAAEAALNAQIAALTDKLNASTALVTRTQEKATALEAALASVKGSESDKDRALQSQQQQAAQIAAAKEALNQQLTTAQAEITTLKQSLTDKESQLQASEKTLLALKAETQTAKALSTATATDQQKAQTELETLKRANQELTDKLASLNAENAAQKAQAEKEKAELLAQAEKLKAGTAAQTQTASQTGPEASAASLKDKASKQSYANGVMFSRLVQKSMDQMTDLGIKTDLPLLLMGIKDGLAQKVAIEPKLLLTLHESMLKELSSREEKKYEAGINQLEKMTAQKKLLKRNKSLFFIQTKAGKKAIAPGETVNVGFKEATVDGRVLNNNASVPVTYDENLPYIFQQALELGKRGGVMEVYCFAGDLYNPDTMPPQLFNYSLMKLTVTISAGK